MSFTPQATPAMSAPASMRSALARLGLAPGIKPDDDPQARCFAKAQALRQAQDLYAKAQLAPDPSVERYVVQLFGALPCGEGGALDVQDAQQDAFLSALEQHTQDKGGNGTRDPAVADQVGLLLPLALARRAEPAVQAWVNV